MDSVSRSQCQSISSENGSGSDLSGTGSLPCLSPAAVSPATLPANGLGGYQGLPNINSLQDVMPLPAKLTSSSGSEPHLASPFDLTSVPSTFGLFGLSEFATSPRAVSPRSHAPRLSHDGSSEPPFNQAFSPIQSKLTSRPPSLVADMSPCILSREQV